jgi:hypothetical protein
LVANSLTRATCQHSLCHHWFAAWSARKKPEFWTRTGQQRPGVGQIVLESQRVVTRDFFDVARKFFNSYCRASHDKFGA